MKFKIAGLLIFMALGTIAYAQDLGLRAGINYATLTGDIEDNESIIAWQIGPYLDFNLSESTDLNLAVLFSKKGTEDSGGDGAASINYLEVPLQFRFYVDPVFFQIGGFGGYVLSAENEGESIKDLIKSGDYGLLFGAGIRLGNIRFDGRYSLGLANIDDVGLGDINTSVLTLGVEVGF